MDAGTTLLVEKPLALVMDTYVDSQAEALGTDSPNADTALLIAAVAEKLAERPALWKFVDKLHPRPADITNDSDAWHGTGADTGTDDAQANADSISRKRRGQDNGLAKKPTWCVIGCDDDDDDDEEEEEGEEVLDDEECEQAADLSAAERASLRKGARRLQALVDEAVARAVLARAGAGCARARARAVAGARARAGAGAGASAIVRGSSSGADEEEGCAQCQAQSQSQSQSQSQAQALVRARARACATATATRLKEAVRYNTLSVETNGEQLCYRERFQAHTSGR